MVKATRREEIKSALICQLKGMNRDNLHNSDLVEDYMSFWDDKVTLRKDVVKRGRKVSKYDSRGQKQTVNNESIDQIIKVNAQMLAILKTLGLDDVDNAEEEDESKLKKMMSDE
ncbi:hypothetical protein LJC49_10485 [Ruminococcaceae bacterium OttesenSCG-928-I18]|nr:hypothetical protein [Ruminococcaceae bacterium OttesenSCG-928-I18]